MELAKEVADNRLYELRRLIHQNTRERPECGPCMLNPTPRPYPQPLLQSEGGVVLLSH